MLFIYCFLVVNRLEFLVLKKQKSVRAFLIIEVVVHFFIGIFYMNTQTQIIILAAGKGTRMGGDIPKALTVLGDKTMVEHVVDTVDELQHDSIMVVGYKAEMVQDCIGDRCRYALQHEQQGTGHAVISAKDLLDETTDTVVILYADQPYVSSTMIEDLIRCKQDNNAKIVIATAVVENDDLFHNQFYNFGRIVRNEAGNITRIVEKKDATEEDLAIREVNPAYFCLDRAWMLDCLSQLKNNNAQGEYYLTDLVQMACDQGHTIHSVQIEAREALGANTPEQLKVLEQHL